MIVNSSRTILAVISKGTWKKLIVLHFRIIFGVRYYLDII